MSTPTFIDEIGEERNAQEMALVTNIKEVLSKEGITVAEYERELRFGLPSTRERTMNAIRQARIAQACKAFEEQKGLIIGEGWARIDARTYYRWKQAEGLDFWKDPKNLEKMLRDNPEMQTNLSKRHFKL